MVKKSEDRYYEAISGLERSTDMVSEELPLDVATVIMSLFHNTTVDPEDLGPDPLRCSREDAVRVRAIVGAVVYDDYVAARVSWALVSGVALRRDPLETWAMIVADVVSGG